MLYTIALIFVLTLLLILLSTYSAESEIHNLLVIAILALLIRGVQTKGAYI
jgi:hypothetical protein